MSVAGLGLRSPALVGAAGAGGDLDPVTYVGSNVTFINAGVGAGLTLPSSTEGDLLFIQTCTTVTVSFDTPTGWTKLGGVFGAGRTVFARIGNGDSSVFVSNSASARTEYVLSAFRNASWPAKETVTNGPLTLATRKNSLEMFFGMRSNVNSGTILAINGTPGYSRAAHGNSSTATGAASTWWRNSADDDVPADQGDLEVANFKFRVSFEPIGA